MENPTNFEKQITNKVDKMIHGNAGDGASGRKTVFLKKKSFKKIEKDQNPSNMSLFSFKPAKVITN